MVFCIKLGNVIDNVFYNIGSNNMINHAQHEKCILLHKTTCVRLTVKYSLQPAEQFSSFMVFFSLCILV